MTAPERDAALWRGLQEAWARVAAVPGPALADASAPLAARTRAFVARLAAFRGRGVAPTPAEPEAQDESWSVFDGLL